MISYLWSSRFVRFHRVLCLQPLFSICLCCLFFIHLQRTINGKSTNFFLARHFRKLALIRTKPNKPTHTHTLTHIQAHRRSNDRKKTTNTTATVLTKYLPIFRCRSFLFGYLPIDLLTKYCCIVHCLIIIQCPSQLCDLLRLPWKAIAFDKSALNSPMNCKQMALEVSLCWGQSSRMTVALRESHHFGRMTSKVTI